MQHVAEAIAVEFIRQRIDMLRAKASASVRDLQNHSAHFYNEQADTLETLLKDADRVALRYFT